MSLSAATEWASEHNAIVRHTFRYIATTALVLLGTLFLCDYLGVGATTTFFLQLLLGLLVQIFSLWRSFWTNDWTGWLPSGEDRRRA